MIVIAREQKARWLVLLPGSTIRVKLLYPNFQRVSKEDIKAALRAISDKRVASSIALRLALNAGVPPAAHCARTERTAGEASDSSVSAEGVFSQAGVVAPPDGLTCGTSVIFSSTV
ncbi:hypothetical protein ACO0LF_29790 [Undibacterium sp. Di27W]|uniref:hypothetical protein n=1 Tax=Undibacterium sp. Di27W TaxID=3413036 RepID=UPI003BF31080